VFGDVFVEVFLEVYEGEEDAVQGGEEELLDVVAVV
jgi:hypothetical protein